MLRFLKSVGIFLAALVILFEEWLWEPLKRLMLRFSRLPVVRQLSDRIARLSPRAAVLVFIAPMVLLFPFKIAGLWLIGHGHALLGLTTFLAAKLMGTAIFAWLFTLTKDSLLRISWFAAAYSWVHRISDAAHAWIHRQAIYRWARLMAARVKARVTRLFKGGAG